MRPLVQTADKDSYHFFPVNRNFTAVCTGLMGPTGRSQQALHSKDMTDTIDKSKFVEAADWNRCRLRHLKHGVL